jgi:UDP-N-acetylmuramyl pentapeptide phosphotransferase/UDP-N-acetylglucosamine-1-phosphate transferase
VEIFAAIILIVLGNIRITYGHGFFGFYHLSYPFSFAITLFIILSIINAFNFIDGIDGLAAGLGIIASFFFGTWFLLAGHIQLSVMSFSLTGSLGGFFLFNVFGNKNKLFMGDTGSLITGLIISILLIKFNELNIDKTLPYSVSAAPVISFSIVIIPLIDTLRVIIIRLSNNRSPFFPDKNHIHHKLLGILNNHFYVTVILVSANILMILLSVLFNHIFINVTFQFIAIFLLGVSFSLIPSHILRKRQNLNREISTFKTKQYKNFITEEI